MEHFIEGALELLFGLFKQKPEQRPAVELKNEFTVRYNKWASVVTLTLLFAGCALFFILSFFMEQDTQILFYVLSILFLMVLLIDVYLFSVRCDVTTERVIKTSLFVFQKEILWDAIICVRIIEKDDESAVTIALYNQEGKCVLDIGTNMENAWYLVEMAQSKKIEIRKEKDLTLKQISRL